MRLRRHCGLCRGAAPRLERGSRARSRHQQRRDRRRGPDRPVGGHRCEGGHPRFRIAVGRRGRHKAGTGRPVGRPRGHRRGPNKGGSPGGDRCRRWILHDQRRWDVGSRGKGRRHPRVGDRRRRDHHHHCQHPAPLRPGTGRGRRGLVVPRQGIQLRVGFRRLVQGGEFAVRASRCHHPQHGGQVERPVGVAGRQERPRRGCEGIPGRHSHVKKNTGNDHEKII
mmetsp:Transcript_3617/g.7908  ORF Transcript_3617/g.7908 Transcript_3617/m.7908 type:complete len:224 (+) Transcript_3617:900-1571(+)